MSRRQRRRVSATSKAAGPRAGDADLQAEVERLRRDLAEARQQLDAIVLEGADAYTRRRMEALDEARLTARGQALEAAAQRGKAVAELRALTDAISKAPGLSGWLMRRRCRHLLKLG